MIAWKCKGNQTLGLMGGGGLWAWGKVDRKVREDFGRGGRWMGKFGRRKWREVGRR